MTTWSQIGVIIAGALDTTAPAPDLVEHRPQLTTSANVRTQTLVYQPGGAGVGPVVFASWPLLMAQLAALRGWSNNAGRYDIVFDDSLVSPAVIPAGGPYDMRDVTWRGRNVTGPATIVAVDIADGASFTALRSFADQLAVTNRNTVTPPCADLASGDYLHIDTASIDTVAGGVAMFSGVALGAGDSVVSFLNLYSSVGRYDTGPVFDFPVAGSFLFAIQTNGSNYGTASLVGAVGATLLSAADGYLFLPSYPGFLGDVLDPRNDAAPTVLPRPYLAAPSAGAIGGVYANDWIRLAAAGEVAQSLPDITPPDARITGGLVVVTDTGAVGNVTASPAAGTTIDGAAAGVLVDPGCSVVFASDGVSDWRRIASFAPTVVRLTTTPARAMGDAFRPSLTHDCLVRYAFTVEAGGAGAGDGYVQLLCDAANPPTVPRDRLGASGPLGTVQKVYGSIGFLVPRGWWVLLSNPPAVNVVITPIEQVEQLVHT